MAVVLFFIHWSAEGNSRSHGPNGFRLQAERKSSSDYNFSCDNFTVGMTAYDHMTEM